MMHNVYDIIFDSNSERLQEAVLEAEKVICAQLIYSEKLQDYVPTQLSIKHFSNQFFAAFYDGISHFRNQREACNVQKIVAFIRSDHRYTGLNRDEIDAYAEIIKSCPSYSFSVSEFDDVISFLTTVYLKRRVEASENNKKSALEQFKTQGNPSTLAIQKWLYTTQAELLSEIESVVHSQQLLQSLDFKNLPAEKTEKNWVVEGLIQKSIVTSLYGHGGVGKSLLMLQLAASIALGGQWLGKYSTQLGKVMAIMCEDDEEELANRMRDIARHLKTSLNVFNDYLKLISRVGERNALIEFQHNGIGKPTPLFYKILNEAKAFRADVIVIDTAADTFPGNENDRSQVSQYVKNCLGRLAIETGSAVILCGHPSKSTESLYAGSTAWNASVRHRMSFKAESGTDVRILKVEKSNYGETGLEIRMMYQDGVFTETDEISGNMINNNQLVLKELGILIDLGNRPTMAPNSPNNAAKLLKHRIQHLNYNNIQDILIKCQALGEAVLIEVRKENRHIGKMIAPKNHPVVTASSAPC